VFVFFFIPVYLYAQCENTARTYTNFQGSYLVGLGALGNPLLAGTISNAANAVNGQVKDASTLSIGAGLLGLASSTQFLEFTTNATNAGARLIPANTPVTLKISVPSEALGLLSGIEIGTFTGLTAVSAQWPLVTGIGNYAGYNAANKNVIYNAANIANVINGSGEIEITLTPGQAYNGIYVKLFGNGLSVALSANLFHAYIMEPSTDSANCNGVIDVLSRVSSTTGSVTNPLNSTDADQSSYTLMNVGTNLLNKIYLTPIFNKPSQPGDSVRMIIQKPSGGSLNLNALTGFTIQPYLYGTPAGTAFNNTSGTANFKLLPGSTDKYVLTFPITQVYDRLEISMGGINGALSTLRIYDIQRKLVKPRTLTDPTATDSRTVCVGSSTSFSVNNAQTCTEYKWYDAETGGNLLYTGLTYNPGNLSVGDYSFYVQGTRTYCTTAVSERLKVTLKVSPLPILSLSGLTVCSGTSTALSVNSPNSNYAYNWYSSVSGGTPLGTGSAYTTPILTSTTTYYVEAVNTLTGCKNAGGPQPVTVTVNPISVVNPITGLNKVCVGSSIMLSNTSMGGIWSSANPSIATVNTSTGEVLGIAAGNVTIQYTIPDGPASCTNHADFNLTVNGLPNITLGSALPICEGITTIALPYSNPINNPATYSLSWTTADFSPVISQVLPATAILLSIPGDAAPGIYTGQLNVRNPEGCSSSLNFSIQIKQIPPKPIVFIQ